MNICQSSLPVNAMSSGTECRSRAEVIAQTRLGNMTLEAGSHHACMCAHTNLQQCQKVNKGLFSCDSSLHYTQKCQAAIYILLWASISPFSLLLLYCSFDKKRVFYTLLLEEYKNITKILADTIS